MEHARRTALRRLVLLLDGAVIAASMPLAYFAHSWLRGTLSFLKDPPPLREYVFVAYVLLPPWLGITVLLGLHRVLERPSSRFERLAGLVKLHGLGLVVLSVVLVLTQAVVNRSLVAVFLSCTFALLYVERSALAAWARWQHAEGTGETRFLLVGRPGAEMDAFVASGRARPLPPRFVGIVTPAPAPRAAGTSEVPAPLLSGIPHRGTIDDLASVLHDEAVDEVLFFPPYSEPRRARRALETCETVGVPASFALDLTPLHLGAARIVRHQDRSFVTFEIAPKPAAELAIKHAFDVIASALGLLVLSPLLLVTALAILVTMGRPVLFAQERAGLRGRPFRMLKFRTMVKDAEQQRDALSSRNEMSGPVFKLTEDPRVTRLGRFLRRTSIDELPQLVNVLLGTMSLVGPRPLPVREQREIRGWHRRRLSMKPGITCLWQISGRSDLDFEQWMALDLRYVDEWSLGLDVRTLLVTVPVVLLRKGAR